MTRDYRYYVKAVTKATGAEVIKKFDKQNTAEDYISKVMTDPKMRWVESNFVPRWMGNAKKN